MGRIILGVIVGFVAWSILWVGGDEFLTKLLPDWYGSHRPDVEDAINQVTRQNPIQLSFSVLIFNLVRSMITSLISGYLAAFVANENSRTTMILGVLLLLVGIGVQVMAWDQLPVWFHIVFLIMLIPVTIAGGRLKKTT